MTSLPPQAANRSCKYLTMRHAELKFYRANSFCGAKCFSRRRHKECPRCEAPSDSGERRSPPWRQAKAEADHTHSAFSDGNACGLVSNFGKPIGAGESFRCIYPDPPWAFDNRASGGRAANHFPTATLDEIEERRGSAASGKAISAARSRQRGSRCAQPAWKNQTPNYWEHFRNQSRAFVDVCSFVRNVLQLVDNTFKMRLFSSCALFPGRTRRHHQHRLLAALPSLGPKPVACTGSSLWLTQKTFFPQSSGTISNATGTVRWPWRKTARSVGPFSDHFFV